MDRESKSSILRIEGDGIFRDGGRADVHAHGNRGIKTVLEFVSIILFLHTFLPPKSTLNAPSMMLY